MGRVYVRLNDVTKHFDRRPVVKGISLDAYEGEVLAMLGASGCGKTTILRIIAGLEVPDSGEVWLGETRVSAGGRNLVPPRARRIGFVFQDLALWPHLTIAESLAFVLASAGMPKGEQARRIAEVLRMVRIERYAHSYPGELSGGEQQRAALARALVASPRLLLLDEPMSSLDAHLKADLIQELGRLHRELNITTVYITHDQAEALALAQRIALLEEGRLRRVMMPDELRALTVKELF